MRIVRTDFKAGRDFDDFSEAKFSEAKECRALRKRKKRKQILFEIGRGWQPCLGHRMLARPPGKTCARVTDAGIRTYCGMVASAVSVRFGRGASQPRERASRARRTGVS